MNRCLPDLEGWSWHYMELLSNGYILCEVNRG